MSEFSFFRGIHLRTGMRTNISIFIRPMITKLDRQVYLENLAHMRLTKQVMVTPSCQGHVTLKSCYYFLSIRAMITLKSDSHVPKKFVLFTLMKAL